MGDSGPERKAPPDALGVETAERSWQVEGPSSAGIAGWWLYEGYMYWWSTEFGGYEARWNGVRLDVWLKENRRRYGAIVRELEATD